MSLTVGPLGSACPRIGEKELMLGWGESLHHVLVARSTVQSGGDSSVAPTQWA